MHYILQVTKKMGVILETGVHDIDIISLIYRMKINQVYDISGSDIHSFEDYATINLRLNHSCQGKEAWAASRNFFVTGKRKI